MKQSSDIALTGYYMSAFANAPDLIVFFPEMGIPES